MAYSTLSALANDSNLVLDGTVSETEHNTHRTNYRALINNLLTEAALQEKNRASSTEPTDKDEGTEWCDTGPDPALLKYYKDGAGSLETLVGTTLTQTLTNKTLTDPTLAGATLTGVMDIPLGTSGLPSLAFTGDLTTGIFSAGAGQTTIARLGVQHTSFTANGMALNELGIRTTNSGTAEFLLTKVIEIGTWNMDTTGSVNVAHALTFSKIREVWAWIRNDPNSNRVNLESRIGTTAAGVGGHIITDATNCVLTRFTTGRFDGSAYDTMGDDGNRGWVYIKYAI